MTDHCYIAVKGSLHSTDSSVFGLTTEEIIALSKRFSDSCKEVINGVLIKGSPIQVINTLGEIGYRVICSSGETEIVWTLRREVLVPQEHDANQDGSLCVREPSTKFHKNHSYRKMSTFQDIDRKNQSPLKKDFENPPPVDSEKTKCNDIKIFERRKESRLGTKPEDFAEYSCNKGSTINVKDIEYLEENPPQADKKVIINTNLSSEANPMSFKNLKPHDFKDFVTTYSEAIAKPARIPLTKKVDSACPLKSAGKQVCTTSGLNEVVLAEFTRESAIVNPELKFKEQPLKSMNARSPIETVNKKGNEQSLIRNQSVPQNTQRNTIIPAQSFRNRSPLPNDQNPQKKKAVERIGTKPEDVTQFGKKVRKIDIVNIDEFVETPEDNVMERRIILNTNLSSDAHPLSGRNLEPQNNHPFPRPLFGQQKYRK